MTKNIYFILLISLFALPVVSSLDIQSLVSSYNYNYFGQEVDIVNVTYYQMNNHLFFDINVSNVTSGNYKFYIDLKDNGNIISGKNTGTVTSSGALVTVNISTFLLSGATAFNYTLRIYNPSDFLVYREANRSTQTISVYDPGYNVLGSNDFNLNNNILQLNISLNTSITSTENLSLTLKYNSNYSISKSVTQSLTNGVNIVSFNFDNQTIKSTHYNGVYNVTSLSVGQKNILIGTNTASYNYENFAQTSYFKRYNSTFRDFDSDNLTDQIDFNFTIAVKSNGIYTVEAEIYDLYDNYVTTLSKNESLTTGDRVVTLSLNGSEIYSKGIDGPYQISESRLLSNGLVIDSEFESYQTPQISYLDFERPPLPDLVPSVSIISNSTGNSTILVNLTNVGNASALNIFLDLFDDNNLDTTNFFGVINASSSLLLNFSYNISNSSIVVALVDIYNDVDETNETNNLAFWSSNLTIPGSPNDTNKFIILNSTNSTVAWLGDLGNIVLGGSCFMSTNCIAPSGSFILGNTTDNSTSYISPSGNLCLEFGSCSAFSATCNPTIDSFVIQNNLGINMSYISGNGGLCFTGGLYQNATI